MDDADGFAVTAFEHVAFSVTLAGILETEPWSAGKLQLHRFRVGQWCFGHAQSIRPVPGNVNNKSNYFFSCLTLDQQARTRSNGHAN